MQGCFSEECFRFIACSAKEEGEGQRGEAQAEAEKEASSREEGEGRTEDEASSREEEEGRTEDESRSKEACEDGGHKDRQGHWHLERQTYSHQDVGDRTEDWKRRYHQVERFRTVVFVRLSDNRQ